MVKEGFNIKKEVNKILNDTIEPIKKPIDFIQSFIEGLILVFKGIAKLLVASLSPFDGKGPFSKIPGLRIPVCFLNPFFVLAYMIVPKIKKLVTESLMPATYPLRYGKFKFDTARNPSMWNASKKDEKWKEINNDTQNYIDDKITIIMWAIFLMFALAFIFLPPIFGKVMTSLPEFLNLIVPTLVSIFIIPLLLSQLQRYIYPQILFLIILAAIRYSWRYIYKIMDKVRDKVFNSKGPKGDPANPLLAKVQVGLDRGLVSIPYVGQFILAYFSKHRKRTLIPLPQGASISMMSKIIKKVCPACESKDSGPDDDGDLLYRNIKSVFRDLDIGYGGENRKLAHTVYLLIFYTWRIILIPGILLYIISRLIRLDNNIANVVAGLLAAFLGVIMIITAIIMIPNPTCDPVMLGPVRQVSKYITMVALPSFIVAWFFPELIEGCFACFEGVTTVKDGFDKMMGGL